MADEVKHLTKLVARELVMEKAKRYTFPAGYTYIVLVDPATGEVYDPRPGWCVTGERLEEAFQPFEYLEPDELSLDDNSK